MQIKFNFHNKYFNIMRSYCFVYFKYQFKSLHEKPKMPFEIYNYCQNALTIKKIISFLTTLHL